MKLILTYFNTTEDLKKVTVMTSDELWEAGVSLDDWDYGFYIEGNATPKLNKDWQLKGILQGCCSNEWYVVTRKDGSTFTLGMAYHS